MREPCQGKSTKMLTKVRRNSRDIKIQAFISVCGGERWGGGGSVTWVDPNTHKPRR